MKTYLVIGLAACLPACGSSKKMAESTVRLEAQQQSHKIAEVLSAVNFSEDLVLDFKVVEKTDTSGIRQKETTGSLRRKTGRDTRQKQTETVTEQQQQQQETTGVSNSERVYQSPWLWIAFTVASIVILAVLFLILKRNFKL